MSSYNELEYENSADGISVFTRKHTYLGKILFSRAKDKSTFLDEDCHWLPAPQTNDVIEAGNVSYDFGNKGLIWAEQFIQIAAKIKELRDKREAAI